MYLNIPVLSMVFVDRYTQAMLTDTGSLNRDRDFRLYLLAQVFIGLGMCVEFTTFNNFFRDVHQLGIGGRTFLELPRETPGFLVSLLVGALAAFGDIRSAAIANLLASLGMFFLGIIPPWYGLMVGMLFIYSSGTHLFMPMNSSIAMSFATDGQVGRKMGELAAASTASLVGGSALLMLVLQVVQVPYGALFGIGSASFLVAAGLIFRMHPGPRVTARRRFVFRREYGLFYYLSILYGARKQLFLTFGPWVIVDVFCQPVSTMAALFLVVSLAGIVLKPLVGRLIDSWGERNVLATEAGILMLVCLLYAFAEDLFPRNVALVLICVLYVLDQCSNNAAMARATWLRRIALKPEDVSPTLSLGISLDHVLSMVLPFLSGLIWVAAGERGYRWVFVLGAVIAALNFAGTRRMVVPSAPGGQRTDG